MPAYMCGGTNVRMHAYTFIHIYIHTHTHTYIYIHTDTHTHIYKYTHTHTYMHTYTRIHTDRRQRFSRCWTHQQLPECCPSYNTLVQAYMNICTGFHVCLCTTTQTCVCCVFKYIPSHMHTPKHIVNKVLGSCTHFLLFFYVTAFAAR
jgi:hypothetical protein